jgi:uridine kinase
MTFAELAERIVALPGTTRLVAIDGCSGAGKSTFAARLSTALGEAPVVHTDDFSTWDNPLDWWPRLLGEVISPLSEGRPATFRPNDHDNRGPLDQIRIDPVPVVIIEGVSASRTEWSRDLAFKVWVSAPRPLRLTRGLERDGEDQLAVWELWMAAEDRYVAHDRPLDRADLVVDAAAPDQPGSEIEFTVGTKDQALSEVAG